MDCWKTGADLQAFVRSTKRQLDFSMDDSSGQLVVRVIASEVGEVVRQIPSEIALKLAKDPTDASSLLFHSKA